MVIFVQPSILIPDLELGPILQFLTIIFLQAKSVIREVAIPLTTTSCTFDKFIGGDFLKDTLIVVSVTILSILVAPIVIDPVSILVSGSVFSGCLPFFFAGRTDSQKNH